jgi:hypothetical protein
MNKKLMILLVIVLITAGCASAPVAAPASTSTPPPPQVEAPVVVDLSTPTQPVIEVVPNTPEPTPTEAPAVKNASDQCDNPYYPVVDGASWTYTNPSIGQFTHTLNVSDDQIFIIQITSADDTVFNMEGQCTQDGVVIMNSGLSTTAQGADGTGTVTTTNQDGVTLPNDIQVGDDWSQTIAFTAAGGNEGFSGTIETSYKAVGYESVSVPAGTFEALKIVQSTSMSIGGQHVMDTSSNLWYVQGIGNVKAEQIINQGDPSINELVSYTIP